MSLEEANKALAALDKEVLREMKAKAGRAGGEARAKKLSSKKRKEIARKAGLARAKKYRLKYEDSKTKEFIARNKQWKGNS